MLWSETLTSGKLEAKRKVFKTFAQENNFWRVFWARIWLDFKRDLINHFVKCELLFSDCAKSGTFNQKKRKKEKRINKTILLPCL